MLKVAHQRKGELIGRTAALGLDDLNTAVAKAWATEALAYINANVYDQFKLSLRCEVAQSRKYRLIRL